MAPILRTLIAGLLFMSNFHTASAQIDTDQTDADSVQRADTTWYFRHDTLFSNIGITIYRGQRLIVGNGSAEEGWYASIRFKSAFAFPLWFMRDQELKVNPDYMSNPERRDADKVRESLHPGDTLIVKKIRSRHKGKKKWHFYELFVWHGRSALAFKYRCDIITALSRKEILLQSPLFARD